MDNLVLAEMAASILSYARLLSTRIDSNPHLHNT